MENVNYDGQHVYTLQRALYSTGYSFPRVPSCGPSARIVIPPCFFAGGYHPACPSASIFIFVFVYRHYKTIMKRLAWRVGKKCNWIATLEGDLAERGRQGLMMFCREHARLLPFMFALLEVSLFYCILFL